MAHASTFIGYLIQISEVLVAFLSTGVVVPLRILHPFLFSVNVGIEAILHASEKLCSSVQKLSSGTFQLLQVLLWLYLAKGTDRQT